ncbi:MAG: hypothetical protein DRN96_08040 [Thermoproteota archaeon]|nr:MAG: hypothetical protein DRN96_08040 [Candidatus Korarchaeota archaeon]
MRAEVLAAVLLLASASQGSSLLGRVEASCVLIERMSYFSSCCSPYWHAKAVVLNSSGEYPLEPGEVIQLIVYAGGSPQDPGTLCRVSGLLYQRRGELKLVVTGAEGFFKPYGPAGEPKIGLSVSRRQVGVGESVSVEFSVEEAPAQLALTVYYPSGESRVLAEEWATPGHRRQLELQLTDPGSYTLALAARSATGRVYVTSEVVYAAEEAGAASLLVTVLDSESGSLVDGALVYLNGSLIGRTAGGVVEVKELSEGVAEVSVSKAGYLDSALQVKLEEGANEVTIALKRAPLEAHLVIEAESPEVSAGEEFKFRVRIEVSREASVHLTIFSSPGLSIRGMEMPLSVERVEEVALRARGARAGVWAIRAAARVSAGSAATYIENYTVVRVVKAEEAEPTACLTAKSIRVQVRGRDALASLSATASAGADASRAADEAFKDLRLVFRLHELVAVESHAQRADGALEVVCTGVLKPMREEGGVFTVVLTDLAEVGVLQVIFELPRNLSLLKAPRGSRVVEFNETTVVYVAASDVAELQYAVKAREGGRSVSLLPVAAVVAVALAALAARRLL